MWVFGIDFFSLSLSLSSIDTGAMSFLFLFPSPFLVLLLGSVVSIACLLGNRIHLFSVVFGTIEECMTCLLGTYWMAAAALCAARDMVIHGLGYLWDECEGCGKIAYCLMGSSASWN